MWIAGGLIAVALTVGGGVLLRASAREKAVWPLALRKAREFGIPASWIMAISRQESSHDPSARAKDPRDLARGGSFGLMQMSLATARGLGFTGAPEQLLDPETNVHWGAKLLAQLAARFGADIRDVASGYNSGKPLASAPLTTREEYVPRVVKFEQEYRGRIA